MVLSEYSLHFGNALDSETASECRRLCEPGWLPRSCNEAMKKLRARGLSRRSTGSGSIGLKLGYRFDRSTGDAVARPIAVRAAIVLRPCGSGEAGTARILRVNRMTVW